MYVKTNFLNSSGCIYNLQKSFLKVMFFLKKTTVTKI